MVCCESCNGELEERKISFGSKVERGPVDYEDVTVQDAFQDIFPMNLTPIKKKRGDSKR